MADKDAKGKKKDDEVKIEGTTKAQRGAILGYAEKCVEERAGKPPRRFH